MKALVLCGGYGRRLGRLCEVTPKPLLRIGERTILEHILRQLANAGVCDVWINLHFEGAQIRSLIGDGKAHGVSVRYIDEPVLQGTAGTIANLALTLEPSGWIVHYGDVVTDHPLNALIEAHHERKADATILVHRRNGSNSRVWFDDDHRIQRFEERPRGALSASDGEPWAFSGICALEDRVLRELDARRPLDLPSDVFSKLTAHERLFAHELRGYRCAVDGPERLAAARGALERRMERIA